MYTMLRVIYTNLDALVAAILTRSREIMKIEISDRAVFCIYLYIFWRFLVKVINKVISKGVDDVFLLSVYSVVLVV